VRLGSFRILLLTLKSLSLIWKGGLLRFSTFPKLVTCWSPFTCHQLSLDFLVVDFHFLSFLVLTSFWVPDLYIKLPTWHFHLDATQVSPNLSDQNWTLESLVLTPTCTSSSFPHLKMAPHLLVAEAKDICVVYICVVIWSMSGSFAYYLFPFFLCCNYCSFYGMAYE
jgi:hypothetical protein